MKLARKFLLFPILLFCFATRYRIQVILEPENHLLSGVEDVEWEADGAAQVQFVLNGGLDVLHFQVGTEELVEQVKKEKFSEEEGVIFYRYSVLLPKKWKTVSGVKKPLPIHIEYKGQIYDPVKPAGTLTFVVGDYTSGLIGKEGIFVSEATRWYARLDGKPSLYDVEIAVPSPWIIVGQGDALPPFSRDNLGVYRFTSEIPFDGYAFAGGNYVVNSLEKNGIRISTYFFEPEAHLSEIFLNKVAEYLEKYSDLLTPYPYKKFDIVENFFTTGYGFPTFTLLGKEVIQMGERALRPGYLNHELVHCWFGNYLYPPPDEENWVEGLTTYIANYLPHEEQSEEAARNYRFGLSQKYSTRVTPEKDYPLRKFAGKTEDYENDIGYSKSAMVFHLIRRIVGDDVFFLLLKDFIRKKGGSIVRWEDIVSLFSSETGTSLGPIITPWLDLPGLPSLRISSAKIGYNPANLPRGEGEWTLDVEISVTPPLYVLPVPYRIDYGDEREDGEIWLKGDTVSLSLRLKRKPQFFSLDPDFHLLTALQVEELPPSLNTLLFRSEKVVAIFPDAEDVSLQPVKERLREQSIPVKKASEIVSVDVLKDTSLILVGHPDSNPWVAKFLPSSVVWKKDVIQVAGKNFAGQGFSLLYTYCVPEECGKRWITLYGGNSSSAYERAHLLFYYGWEPYVVFSKGVPFERGIPYRLPMQRTFSFAEIPVIPPDKVNMKNTVQKLSAPDMAGRKTGTGGEKKAAEWLEEAFRQMGLEPWREQGMNDYRQPFSFTVPTYAAEMTLSFFGKKVVLPVYPLQFSAIPEQGSFAVAYYSEGPELPQQVLPVSYLFIWKVPEKPEKKLWEYLAGWNTGEARKRLSGVLLLLPPESPFPPEWFSRPDYIYPGLERKWEEMKNKGVFASSLLHLASSLSTLEMKLPSDFSVAVFFLPYSEWLEKVMGKRVVTQGWQKEINGKWQVEKSAVKVESVGNIVGKVKGWDAQCGKEVVLGAHYDHLGEGFPGGIDNASGVAVLLEVARLMKKEPFSCDVVFVAFSGEEWGLRGSRNLVGHLRQPERIWLMVNLDSVGGTSSETFYLIGRSKFPEIAGRMQQALGKELEKDIDRYAYEFGSDFYPFSLAGIPAVGIWDAEYQAMHSPLSGAEKVSSDKLYLIAHALRQFLFTLKKP
ncbi:MAG: M28 family peptidase [bacterium JZ-2024 1]